MNRTNKMDKVKSIIKELKSINNTLQLIASKMECVDKVEDISVHDFANELDELVINQDRQRYVKL